MGKTTRKSPDLEVISDSLERRKRPRINLSTEQFRLNPSGKIFSVADVSTEGMAFRVLEAQDLALLPVATEISGMLNLHGEKLPVYAKVRRIGSKVVGCEFLGLSKEVKQALERILDPKTLGSQLRPFPSADPKVLWFHGRSSTDLIYGLDAQGLPQKFTLYALGYFIQRDENGDISTGRALPEPRTRHDGAKRRTEDWGVVEFESLLMQPDESPEPGKLSVAKAVILSSNLPQELKSWSLKQLG